MCFSAMASFTAAGVLGALGAAGVTLAMRERALRALPFAAGPMLFAVQQLSEGFVWMESNRAHGACLKGDPASVTFTLFAFAFWPVWIPLSAILLEPRLRRIQAVLLGIGALIALYLLTCMIFAGGAQVTQSFRGNLLYDLSVPGKYIVRGFYVAVTTGALLVSSHRELRWAGALFLLGFAVSYVLWNETYISVWCFFAAGVSAIHTYAIRVLLRRGVLTAPREASDARFIAWSPLS
jgi:hypothetical protein